MPTQRRALPTHDTKRLSYLKHTLNEPCKEPNVSSDLTSTALPAPIRKRGQKWACAAKPFRTVRSFTVEHTVILPGVLPSHRSPHLLGFPNTRTQKVHHRQGANTFVFIRRHPTRYTGLLLLPCAGPNIMLHARLANYCHGDTERHLRAASTLHLKPVHKIHQSGAARLTLSIESRPLSRARLAREHRSA